MANRKITDLPLLTETDSEDRIYIVDSSDTTESPQGTSKQIKFSDLGGNQDLQSVTDNGDDTSNRIKVYDSNETGDFVELQNSAIVQQNSFGFLSLLLPAVTSLYSESTSAVLDGTTGSLSLSTDTNQGAVTIESGNVASYYSANLPNKPNGSETFAMLSDLSNLPTDDQKAAMDNASLPSATNPFITNNQIIGGLPTGQMPSGYINRLTPYVISSPTFEDIPLLTTSITLASAVKGYSLFSFECDATGADARIELRIVLNGETSDAIFIDFSKEGTSNGSINFRTTNDIPAGTHTIKAQARKVGGNKVPSINKGFLFGLGLQAPKGDTGFGVASGGLENQVLTKIDGSDYNTQWSTLDFETTTQLNTRDSNNRSRANHTGTQTIATVTGLQTALDGKQNTLTNPVTVLATSPQIVDKRWYGTQAQYTALGTYDNNTEYNII
jgi:hypothetical protein